MSLRLNRFLIGVLTAIHAYGCTVYAHQPQDGEIRATGALYTYRNVVRDHAFDPPWLTGGGVIVEGDLDDNGGAELSAFYLRQFYSIQKEGKVLDVIGKRMYVIAAYRHWWTPYFSTAAGLYSSYAMGDQRIVSSDFPTGQNPKTSASDATDYGFDFSLQVEPYQEKNWGVIVDTRYSRSVTAKPGEASDFYGVIVGIKFLAQQRTPTPDDKD